MGERPLQTSIATSDEQCITVRGADLTEELMGTLDFGEFFYFHLTGEMPTDSESRVFNTLLVTVIEHGITPSVIAARLTYDSAPEAVQGAVTSGLLGAGKTFLGSMQDVAEMVQDGVSRIDAGEPSDAVAHDAVAANDRLPGFGHPEHDPTDPRTERIFAILEAEEMDGPYLEFIYDVQDAAEAQFGSRPLINATGAIGVGVSELGLDPLVARGIALVSRSAGLIGHLNEEADEPMARDIWDIVEENVDYRGEP